MWGYFVLSVQNFNSVFSGCSKVAVKKPMLTGGSTKVDTIFKYNSRRNNMDFGTCFVVFLVIFLFIAAWLDEQMKKKR
jgi:hypothetical protein